MRDTLNTQIKAGATLLFALIVNLLMMTLTLL